MTITLTEKDFSRLASHGAAYIRVGPGLTGFSVDVGDRGMVYADYDPLGVLVGVEFLEACTIEVSTRIRSSDKRFLRASSNIVVSAERPQKGLGGK